MASPPKWLERVARTEASMCCVLIPVNWSSTLLSIRDHLHIHLLSTILGCWHYPARSAVCKLVVPLMVKPFSPMALMRCVFAHRAVPIHLDRYQQEDE